MNRLTKNSSTTPTGNTGYIATTTNLTVLNLHGSYDEMGQQYGALASDQLKKIYNDIATIYFDRLNIKTAIAYVLRKYYECKIDHREREILNGMAKTSGLTYDQLLDLDVLPLLITLFGGHSKSTDHSDLATLLTEFANHPVENCSFASVWGNKSQDHSMLVARNLDLPSNIISLAGYTSLVVYQPNNGDNKVAVFGFMGSIPGFSWVSNKGLFAEYNDGSKSVPGYNVLRGFMGLNINFYALLNAANTTEFIDYIKSHPTLISNLTAIVNSSESFSIENPAEGIPVVLTGQMENANFFTNLYRTQFKKAKLTTENCIDKVQDTPSYACRRYHVIKNYLANNPVINVDDLKAFFTTAMDDNGIYQTGKSVNYPVNEITVYTLLGSIATGKYYYSNFSDKTSWTEIDIQQLFNS